jgi:hypothetical protein
MVVLDQPARKVPQVLMDLQVILAHKDHKALLDQLVLMAQMVVLVHKVHREKLDQQAQMVVTV